MTFIAPKAATPRQRSRRRSACRLDAVGDLGRERIGGIAERLEPVENDRRIGRAVVPFDGDALAGEIDPRAAHARFFAQALFDGDDAGAAMDAVDDEIHRRQPSRRVADEEREILRLPPTAALPNSERCVRRPPACSRCGTGARRRGSPRSQGPAARRSAGVATPS